MTFTEFIVDVMLTAIAYMGFPIIRMLINGGKFEKKQAHKIALWNSIVWGLVFCVVAAEADITWNAFPAVLYYWINKAILSEKAKDSNDASKEDNPKTDTDREDPIVEFAPKQEHLEPQTKKQAKIEELDRLYGLYNEKKLKFKREKIIRCVLAFLGVAICCFALLMAFVGERSSNYILIDGRMYNKEGLHQLIAEELASGNNGVQERYWEKNRIADFLSNEDDYYRRGDILGSSDDHDIFIETIIVSLVLAAIILACGAFAFRLLFQKSQNENEILEGIRKRIREVENSDPR